jgi:hypothetical protein
LCSTANWSSRGPVGVIFFPYRTATLASAPPPSRDITWPGRQRSADCPMMSPLWNRLRLIPQLHPVSFPRNPLRFERITLPKLCLIDKQEEIRSFAVRDAAHNGDHILHSLPRVGDRRNAHLLESKLFDVPASAPAVEVRFEFPRDAAMICAVARDRNGAAIHFKYDALPSSKDNPNIPSGMTDHSSRLPCSTLTASQLRGSRATCVLSAASASISSSRMKPMSPRSRHASSRRIRKSATLIVWAINRLPARLFFSDQSTR